MFSKSHLLHGAETISFGYILLDILLVIFGYTLSWLSSLLNVMDLQRAQVKRNSIRKSIESLLFTGSQSVNDTDTVDIASKREDVKFIVATIRGKLDKLYELDAKIEAAEKIHRIAQDN